MNRHPHATIAVWLAVTLITANFASGLFADDRSNVIIIYSDDHGYTDLGLHGIDDRALFDNEIKKLATIGHCLVVDQ